LTCLFFFLSFQERYIIEKKMNISSTILVTALTT